MANPPKALPAPAAPSKPVEVPASVMIDSLRRFLAVAEEQRNGLAHENMELRAQKAELMEALAANTALLEQAQAEIERLTAAQADAKEEAA